MIMKVLYLILNYKTYQETIKLTDELLANGLTDSCVLIVDNASPNESYKELCTCYEKTENVEVIQSPENGGYAKGNNYGLRYAKKYVPEYVCIINNDVHFTKETIEQLCEWYEKLPHVALIAPKQILPGGREATFSSLETPTLRTDLSWYNPFTKKRHQYIENTDIKGVNEAGIIPGAFLFTKYSVFESLGFFDESTFLFCEERFTAKKAEMAGLKNYIILTETYLHDHSTTIKKEASEKRQRKMILEGRLLYHKKYSNHPVLACGLLKTCYYLNELYLKTYSIARSAKHRIK